MDYASMSVDELDAVNVDFDNQIQALRAQAKELRVHRDRKIVLEALATRLGVPVDGLTDDQATALLGIARAQRAGDVVVTPDTGSIDLSAQSPEVQS